METKEKNKPTKHAVDKVKTPEPPQEKLPLEQKDSKKKKK